MRSILASISMALLVAACGTPPGEVEHARVAEARAREWLALVDAGDYGGSWETAAWLFQTRMSKLEWEERAGRVQPTLGQLKGRQLVATKYTKVLPWEMRGEHVVIQYRTALGRRAIVETLTMRRDDDQWRTIGYLIRAQ